MIVEELLSWDKAQCSLPPARFAVDVLKLNPSTSLNCLLNQKHPSSSRRLSSNTAKKHTSLDHIPLWCASVTIFEQLQVTPQGCPADSIFLLHRPLHQFIRQFMLTSHKEPPSAECKQMLGPGRPDINLKRTCKAASHIN